MELVDPSDGTTAADWSPPEAVTWLAEGAVGMTMERPHEA